MELDLVLRAVLAPAVLAVAAGLVIAFLLRSRRAGRDSDFLRPHPSSRVVALLVPLAAALSSAALEGRPMRPFLVPAGTAFEWLPFAIAAGALVAAAVGDGAGRLGRIAASVGAAAVSVGLLIPPGMRDGTAQLVAAAVAGACAFGASGERSSGTARFASWWLVLSVASAMVLLSGFAKLAFMIASVAALSAALALLAPFLCAFRAGVSANVALSIALSATAFIGAGYDEAGFPLLAWILLATAPASSALAELPRFAARPRARFALMLALPALVACTALAIGFAATRPSAAATDAADLYGLAASP